MDKIYLKQRLIIFGLTTGLIFTLAGSLCGTFAWYTYGSRAPIYYDGTSIGSGGSLEIGVESSVVLDNYEFFGLTEDTSIPEKTIYWSSSSFPANALRYVLSHNNSATNKLRPVTTGKHKIGEAVTLYNGPEHRTDQNDPLYLSEVDAERFVNLPLVFRYRSSTEANSYYSDYTVYLESAIPNSYTNIKEGIRLLLEGHDEEGTATQYLIDPNELEESSLPVGGPLDLNSDDYYDTYAGGDFIQYEIAYGQFVDDVIVHNPEVETSDSEVNPEDLSTFNANHKEGTKKLDLEATIPETCEYMGKQQFVDHTIALTYPEESFGNYAFLNAKIYLEGWDLSIINPNVGAQFSLDLSFEVILHEAE